MIEAHRRRVVKQIAARSALEIPNARWQVDVLTSEHLSVCTCTHPPSQNQSRRYKSMIEAMVMAGVVAEIA